MQTRRPSALPTTPGLLRAAAAPALLLVLLFLAAGGCTPTPGPPDPPSFDHVVVISVDGLRGDALEVGASLPAFDHLRRGAGTLNARTDADSTLTVPNNLTIVTGRPTRGPDGHHWVVNDVTEELRVLHEHRGEYVHSVFDVAHDHGVDTGAFVTKSKLNVIRFSWDHEHGAPDLEGDDDGRGKIDRFVETSELDLTQPEETVRVTDEVIAHLRGGAPRTLSLVHYHLPDRVGHRAGWFVDPGSHYMRSVSDVDIQIGRLLDAIEGDARLVNTTAVILTSDHGGSEPISIKHSDATAAVNFTIPFLVWTADDLHSSDLYAINRHSRSDPGVESPPTEANPPPIRNGDTANLALSLLGLPPIPGSVFNVRQDLRRSP